MEGNNNPNYSSVNESEELLGAPNLHLNREELANAAQTTLRSRRTMNICVALLVTFVVFLGVLVSSTSHFGPKRNVIMMVSDGFGPASETYGRLYYQYKYNKTFDYQTPLDKILVGQSRTRSSSSSVTDSAAGATAFSCAIKSFNGAIAVDDNKVPCGTVLEAAKRKGLSTGLVVTSRITHATPGAFSAHVPYRDMEDEIAEHQLGFYPLGRNVDLMFGGGRCHFIPRTNGSSQQPNPQSCRVDNRDLLEDGKKKLNWKFLETRQEFDNIDIKDKNLFPLAGLFSKDHMDYEVDRDNKQQPSLKEMTIKALDILGGNSKRGNKGFFLMVEGSRIDMGAHDNDPVAHIHEILAYYEAVEAVRNYVSSHPDTVMISTSDHETGGFTLGRQIGKDYPEYVWYPEVIDNVKHSSNYLAQLIFKYSGKNKERYISNEILSGMMNINDPTPAELEALESKNFIDVAYTLSDMVSRRALIGWTTHGHTGVDVNLYAYGNLAEQLAGNHENTDVGKFIVSYLDLNLSSITKKLKNWKLEVTSNLRLKAEKWANPTRHN